MAGKADRFEDGQPGHELTWSSESMSSCSSASGGSVLLNGPLGRCPAWQRRRRLAAETFAQCTAALKAPGPFSFSSEPAHKIHLNSWAADGGNLKQVRRSLSRAKKIQLPESNPLNSPAGHLWILTGDAAGNSRQCISRGIPCKHCPFC